jgi:hypothetical protein
MSFMEGQHQIFLSLNAKKNFIHLQKTLGVPCAEKYPLNLMQLVLPKGKVGQHSSIVV